MGGRVHDGLHPLRKLGNPLTSEAAAFRWLVVVALVAAVLVALLPAAVELPSLASVAILAIVLNALVAYEAIRFGELRERLRRQLLHEAAAD